MHQEKNLKYQLPKKYYGKLENLTEPGHDLQIDFTGKLHNKNIHGEVQTPKRSYTFYRVTSICTEYWKKSNLIKEERLSPKNTEKFARTEILKSNDVPPEHIRETE